LHISIPNLTLVPIANPVWCPFRNTLSRLICIVFLDQLIETNLKDGNKYSKLLIGYKLFSDLMNDPIFYTEVSNSALSATKRKYKQLKIKITTHQYQLHFE